MTKKIVYLTLDVKILILLFLFALPVLVYKKDLEKEIESETSNDFEKLLKALLHVNIYVIDHHL